MWHEHFCSCDSAEQKCSAHGKNWHPRESNGPQTMWHKHFCSCDSAEQKCSAHGESAIQERVQ
jgi:hypothetical protein